MKKYIGTKEVSAQPMTAQEAVIKGYKIGNHENENGYEVEYKDGYKSWSPKDVFEEAYKLSETFIDRLNIEIDELSTKMTLLYTIIHSDKFSEYSSTSQNQLKAQYRTMSEGISILISRFNNITAKKNSHLYFAFGVAISYLMKGQAVRRKEWDDKKAFVVKQIPAHIGSDVIPKMQSLPQSAKDLILNDTGFIDYTNQMLIVNSDGRADSWVPSSSDVFADDWELVCE